jgi:glycosyltransferase involved in cell wall biosynthesis
MPGPHAFNRRMIAFWAEECGRYGFGDMHNDTTYAGGLFAYFVTRRRKMLEEFELAHRIIVPSDFVRDTFREEGVPEAKLVLIPRAVDIARFRPAGEAPTRFRAIFVGAIGHRKGVHYLLDAWQRLALPDAELLLAGGVQAEIAPLVARHEGKLGVRCLGHVDPLPLYQSGSIFVFPSLSEGSAKVTYEAMACGLPVVVTPNAGSVARDGVDGFVVPVRDAEALAEGIGTLYRDPELRRVMGRAARTRAEAYTWEHYRARILAAYADALGLPRPEVRLPGAEAAPRGGESS